MIGVVLRIWCERDVDDSSDETAGARGVARNDTSYSKSRVENSKPLGLGQCSVCYHSMTSSKTSTIGSAT